MDMFVVQGGRPLRGRVAVSGAKNAALPIMAAALATDGPTTLHGVPDLVDVRTMAALLQTLGVAVERAEDGSLQLEVVDKRPAIAEYELVRRMRASVCVLGPLLGRRGRAAVSLPGGCNIGHRPIDLHLRGLEALGADIRIERGYVVARANRLKGASLYLGGACGSTVTGTCNVMAAAVFAKGTTTIEAAACEPEVEDLGRYLNAMGARISGLGTPTLRIDGVDRLEGTTHTVIPDRIEAATLMIAAAMTRGEVTLDNVRLDHMTAVVRKLEEIGVKLQPQPEGAVHIDGTGPLRPADCIALPYPAIPTDVQAQLTALLTQAEGISVVTDKVFPDRFMHVSEMARMGARVRREGQSAIIAGGEPLSGASVMASDLRASAALVLAALAARGESVVRRIYHLDRGYERFEERLRMLGADIRRVVDTPANVPASLHPLSATAPESEAA
ncbi:UDP-N-acetylglucosamine 1-carboxyvinyltransferase MurA [Maioricimonas rarisocia]|uniref:UDP-N-acetylglucosamine 1-carboxyvinyltransferase n=1 Tax=Maioricimonas rarisocia TaxID=2528026 RepID=A0A517ZFW2_9PLAN|nr:UDP-N-acetylglucosamine 1-carboxyvinyltransferase [Maioricimonas rarisocia]QDU41365.1 UDP-N-acetylglucosamine 1-carboxyvinyltransferase MurA [Maioricimonas rarisocia]